MPAAWVGAAAALYGATSGGGGGGGGGGGSSTPQYVPTGLGAADSGWLNAYATQGRLADQAQWTAMPAFGQSYENSQRIDYAPYIQGANQGGQMYGQAGQMAGQQIGGYAQQAQQAQGQQQQLYGAGAQVLDTAMDPQNALYDRTAQRVQDQVRAGQAVRGLGNSAQGAGEEDQAMSNFNIDWQNNQLSRQTQGIQADVNANAAGVNQGKMYGADQSAGLAAGVAGAGYYQQAGQVPTQAQQYVAGQPAANAAAYVGGVGSVQQGYGNYQGAAIPYMNFGNGAIQGNYNNAYTANRDAAAGMGQLGSALGGAVQNNWGAISNWFGGSGSGQGSVSGGYVDPGTGATYNNPSAYTAPSTGGYSGDYVGVY